MKSKIVYIQPIFCPCEELFRANKNSLISLLEYLKNNRYRIDICLAGWCIKDKYWDELFEIYQDIKKLDCVVIDIVRFDHNYGKSYIVNKLFDSYFKINPEVEYILTFDSDIGFDSSEKNMFERLIVASDNLEIITGSQFGCLSLNLRPNQYNDLRKNKNLVYEFDGFTEELLWDSIYAGGYAGGALFVNVKAWININGYKRYSQSYAPEDAFLFLSLNAFNYSVAIITSLFAIHPENSVEIYTQWKGATMNKKDLIFKEFDQTDFLGHVLESEKFWRHFNETT